MPQERISVPIHPLEGNEDLPLPDYRTEHSAAMDLHAAVKVPVTLSKNEIALIPCGFAMALPQGFEAQIRPRSGLAAQHGIMLVNSPGTIDADYRGEVKVILLNHGEERFVVERGMRIAQMLVVPVPKVEWVPVGGLPGTSRGSGGFGHTGH